MPTGRNWINFLFINIGFFAQILVMFYLKKSKEIKEDWNSYRCNPMYMPMSDDMSSDFTYCVQNIQSDMMDDLLEPLTYTTTMLSDLGTSMGDDINVHNGRQPQNNGEHTERTSWTIAERIRWSLFFTGH